MKRLLIAGTALLVLVPAIWLASSSGDPGTRPSPGASASPGEEDAKETAEQTAEEATEAPLSLVQEILDERALALLKGDARSFLASVDPSAKRFRKRQRLVFKRLSSLPLKSYDLEVVPDTNLTKPRHARHYKRVDDLLIARVEERYRIRRFDDADFISDLALTFVLRDDEWLLASDDDIAGDAKTNRNLWDFDRVTTVRSRSVLVLQHPCGATSCNAVGESFLQLAETGLQRVAERWREPWNERVVVLVTASDRELRSILDVDFDIANFVAFTYAAGRGRGYSSARIVVNRDTLAGRSSEDVLTVLTHELMHVATRRLSGPHVPLWVEEGLAEWVSRTAGDDGDIFFDGQLATGELKPILPGSRDFRRGDGDRLFVQYQSSRSAVTYFIDRFGYKKFVRFYSRLGDSHKQPGNAREHLEATMRRVIGLSPREFERQWADTIAP